MATVPIQYIELVGGILLLAAGVYLVLRNLVGFLEGFFGLVLLAIGAWLIYISGL